MPLYLNLNAGVCREYSKVRQFRGNYKMRELLNKGKGRMAEYGAISVGT